MGVFSMGTFIYHQNYREIQKNLFQKRNLKQVTEYSNERTIFTKPTNHDQVISHVFYVSLFERSISPN